MTEFKGTPQDIVDAIRVEEFEGFGEITVGGSSDNWRLIITAMSLLDHPLLNKFFLANKLKLSDRITKTKMFPRVGMSLPNGEVYKDTEEEVI